MTSNQKCPPIIIGASHFRIHDSRVEGSTGVLDIRGSSRLTRGKGATDLLHLLDSFLWIPPAGEAPSLAQSGSRRHGPLRSRFLHPEVPDVGPSFVLEQG